MSPLVVFVGLLLTFFLLRFLIEPMLTRRLSASSLSSSLLKIGAIGFTQAVNSCLLMLTISSGIIVTALYVLDKYASFVKSTVSS
jgi:hypothetical protein